MKRILLLTLGLFLSAGLFGQPLLTEQEWNSIPPAVRVKIKEWFSQQTIMVEDGQYYYAVPAGSIFTQVSRERKVPEEGNYVYSRWCDMTDVNASYFSPDLFQMTRRLPKIDIQGKKLDLTPIIREFSGLYMLDFARYRKGDPNVSYCRNTTQGGLRKDIRDFLDSKGYKTLMDYRKDGQYTRLYMTSDGRTVTGFVLVNLDYGFDYGRFVCLEGQIPQEQFNRLIANIIR